jgi:hypothetical protein
MAVSIAAIAATTIVLINEVFDILDSLISFFLVLPSRLL